MRLLAVLAVVGALLSAGLCVRLGLWQLGRLREKQALNAALAAAREGPPLAVSGDPPPAGSALARPLRVTGRFDETRQFLLSGRLHDGEPGVGVVTPMLPAGSGTAILVDRGWLPAADAATARPQDHPEAGERTVLGMAEALPRGAGGPPPRPLAGDRVALWSLRGLDADSIASRLPYPLAPYVLRALPEPGSPALPRRTAPRPHDTSVHLGYAIQWFLFAAIVLGGSIAFVRTRARRGAAAPHPEVSR